MTEVLQEEVRKLHQMIKQKDTSINDLRKFAVKNCNLKSAGSQTIEEQIEAILKGSSIGVQSDENGVDLSKEKMLVSVLNSNKPIDAS